MPAIDNRLAAIEAKLNFEIARRFPPAPVNPAIAALIHRIAVAAHVADPRPGVAKAAALRAIQRCKDHPDTLNNDVKILREELAKYPKHDFSPQE